MSDSLKKTFLVNYLNGYRDELERILGRPDYPERRYILGALDGVTDVLREIEAGDFDQ